MPAPTGNKNAQLGQQPLDSNIVLRVTRQEKATWTRAARPEKLATWVRSTLNQAAQSGDQSGRHDT